MFRRTLLALIVLSMLVLGLAGCKEKTTKPLEHCATPQFSLAGGTYPTEKYISLSCATEGIIIRYTMDGSLPTASSDLYNNTIPINETTVLKAKAFKTGMIESETASATYTIVATPAGMAFVQGGTYWNFSSHVTVSPYFIGKFEVTQAEYEAVMGTNPATSSHGIGANYPIYNITWHEAIIYCNKASINAGFTPCYSYNNLGTNPADWPAGWEADYLNHTNLSCNWSANGYRLPTEAEWEFAAHGGVDGGFYAFYGYSSFDEICWYNINSGGKTHPVGQKGFNELGLYDMCGNVGEFCWDIYAEAVADSNLINPHGPATGPSRVWRGGSWYLPEENCQNWSRTHTLTNGWATDRGFRVCRIAN